MTLYPHLNTLPTNARSKANILSFMLPVISLSYNHPTLKGKNTYHTLWCLGTDQFPAFHIYLAHYTWFFFSVSKQWKWYIEPVIGIAVCCSWFEGFLQCCLSPVELVSHSIHTIQIVIIWINLKKIKKIAYMLIWCHILECTFIIIQAWLWSAWYSLVVCLYSSRSLHVFSHISDFAEL